MESKLTDAGHAGLDHDSLDGFTIGIPWSIITAPMIVIMHRPLSRNRQRSLAVEGPFDIGSAISLCDDGCSLHHGNAAQQHEQNNNGQNDALHGLQLFFRFSSHYSTIKCRFCPSFQPLFCSNSAIAPSLLQHQLGHTFLSSCIQSKPSADC